jgi:hypothetical protein
MTGYSHPKCYLSFTNDCSSDITKEHYISDSLLKLLEHRNTVKITGLRWIENQTFRLISKNSLTAHILCARHNNRLHDLDTEMLYFFEAVKKIEEVLKGKQKIRAYLEFSLDGHKIERWLIKLGCGIIASNQVPGVDQVVVKPECYDCLISGAEMPENWGLYFSGENRQFDTSIDFSIRYASGELKALDFSVHNFVHTHLVLGRPGNPLAFGTYRPHNLVFRSITSRVDHNIELKWLVDRGKLAVIYTRLGSTDKPPPNREPWMNVR